MKNPILPLAAVAAALALAACGKGPTTPSTPGLLVGTVIDSTSASPLAGAKVVAGSTDSTATDANGRFSLSLPQGRYAVQVSKDGYYGAAANVPVISRDTTDITVYTRLRPWTPGTAMPEARHNFATAAVLNEIFVIAGIGVAGGSTTRYSSLLSYVPSSSLWTTSGLTPISFHRELPGCSSMGTDRIFVIGGSVGTGDTSLCQEYSPLLNSWTNHAPPPAACRAMSAATVGDSIFVFGGYRSGAVTDSVRVYKPSADTTGGLPWRTAACLPSPRAGMSCAVVGGMVYLFGGVDASEAARSSSFRFDPANNSWATVADMPAARAYAACAPSGNRIYVFGGVDAGAARSSSYRYDPSANTWATMEDMPLARYGAGAATVANRIYVIGGFDGTNSLSVQEVYNPSADLK